MKIILHIGVDKYGSTAIQNCLFHNEELFKEKGFFIASHTPKRKSFRHSIYFQEENVHLFKD